MNPRTTSSEYGSPVPVQWLRMRFVESWLLSSSGTATEEKSPKPVVMP